MPTATKDKDQTERNIKKAGEVAKVGNLTRDPELHFAPSGAAVVRTGLAVERPKVPGDWAGERVTEFYELAIFNVLGENAAECLAKGTRVVVVGNAEMEKWTGDDGKERTTKRILVNAIGPDLRWATAAVTRATRKDQASRENSTGESAPVPLTADDEEPF